MTKCPYCKRPFRPTSPRQLYCTPRCTLLAMQEQDPSAFGSREKAEEVASQVEEFTLLRDAEDTVN